MSFPSLKHPNMKLHVFLRKMLKIQFVLLVKKLLEMGFLTF